MGAVRSCCVGGELVIGVSDGAGMGGRLRRVVVEAEGCVGEDVLGYDRDVGLGERFGGWPGLRSLKGGALTVRSWCVKFGSIRVSNSERCFLDWWSFRWCFLLLLLLLLRSRSGRCCRVRMSCLRSMIMSLLEGERLALLLRIG